MNARAIAIPLVIALTASLDAQPPQIDPAVQPFLFSSPVPRRALVIGVEHYEHFDAVDNALNDARAIGSTLGQLGFGFVRQLADPSQAEIITAADELKLLAGDASEPAVIVIFYAGHGFQDGAFNYIVPKDARADHLVDDSILVADLVGRFAPRRAGITVLFFDACRKEEPLVAASGPGAVRPGSALGFGQVQNSNGAVLGLAPAWNHAALSKVHASDVDSPYTTGLILGLNREDASAFSILSEAYSFVTTYTNSRQTPEQLVTARADRFRFHAAGPTDADLALWQATVATARYDCVTRYVTDHPDSPFLKAAVGWLAANSPKPTDTGGTGCPGV